jgi:hypothetical protein
MRREHVSGRSSMNTALMTRLLGMTVTLFILILTVKSELLEYQSVSWQLVLSMPLLLAALIANSKVVNVEKFEKYRYFILIVNSVSIALVSNTIGLLVAKYVSLIIGVAYFALFIGLFGYFFKKDWADGKVYNEIIVISISILFGLIPALCQF